jgi:hypothetical protein
MTAYAQFKVVGPAPYPPTVARQKIRTLLEGVDPGNRQQTIETLTGLLSWYRDILDEELIAAWQKDTRAKLTEVTESLADSRVASGVVEFSWRERRPAAFHPAYAPMFVNLMTRFPESAQPFLDDLLGPMATGQQTPNLSQPEAETVCRILLDMPDIEAWRRNALQILPHYRRVAESLLVQDLHRSDREKSYRAERWLADLKADVPSNASEQPSLRRKSTPSPSSAAPGGIPPDNQTESVVLLPGARSDRPPAPAAANSAPVRPPPPSAAAPAAPAAPAAALPSAVPPYNRARFGTLECTGAPIPQNAEYVFRNVPPVKMQLDYDTKTWDARLLPGDGQTQKVILRNKSSGPQKHCIVHWSVIP